MAEHDLQAVAFPTLDEAQVATLGSCAGASLTKYRAGQTLFRCGDRDAKFFIIKSGQVEIRDETGDAPKVVVVHKPGEFTGEAGQLTGRPAVVTAVAQTDCEVYPVSPDALRHILNRCPDLGDLILQAFIARQQLLRESAGFTGLRVIGSRYSRDTFRIRDFLARNRILFTWLDLESDPQVNQLLKQVLEAEALFSFIGAVPRTDWLPKEIEIDSKGFVRTGPALAQSPAWSAKRPPFLLETSRPGVFAAGDVRSGSVKRVASAVGEGAMAVQFVHEYLKEM
jgi:CRP-like cAMP-binding protein